MNRKKSWDSNTHIRQNTFHRRAIKRDSESHFKGRIHQEDINIVNINAPNIRESKYIKKILEDFKKDDDSNTIKVWILTPHYKKWIDLPNKISTKIWWH